MTKPQKTPFEIACSLFETKAAFARALNVEPPYINKMLRDKHVPTEQCRNIERATGGRVTAAQLRPDVFGPIDYASESNLSHEANYASVGGAR